MSGTYVATYVDAAAVAKANVEHRYVGRASLDCRQRSSCGAVVTHNLEVIFRIQDIGDPATNDFMIVEEEKPNRSSLLENVRFDQDDIDTSWTARMAACRLAVLAFVLVMNMDDIAIASLVHQWCDRCGR